MTTALQKVVKSAEIVKGSKRDLPRLEELTRQRQMGEALLAELLPIEALATVKAQQKVLARAAPGLPRIGLLAIYGGGDK